MSKSVTVSMLSKNWKEKRYNMRGGSVKKFRKKKNLIQDNLATKADISYTTLTKLQSNVVKNPLFRQ